MLGWLSRNIANCAQKIWYATWEHLSSNLFICPHTWHLINLLFWYSCIFSPGAIIQSNENFNHLYFSNYPWREMCLGIFQVSVILRKDSVALCLKKVLIVLLLAQDSYIFYFKHFFSSISDIWIHHSRLWHVFILSFNTDVITKQ